MKSALTLALSSFALFFALNIGSAFAADACAPSCTVDVGTKTGSQCTDTPFGAGDCCMTKAFEACPAAPCEWPERNEFFHACMATASGDDKPWPVLPKQWPQPQPDPVPTPDPAPSVKEISAASAAVLNGSGSEDTAE